MKRIVITPTMYTGDKSFNTYLSDIRKFDDNESDIIKRIENGDESARELLVTNNLRFVITVAKQYLNIGAKLPDMISDGNLGLIIAAQRFDPSTGFKFISFAVWWIRAKILENMQLNCNVVKIPSNKTINMGVLNRKIASTEQELCSELTYSEALNIFPEDKDLLDMVFSMYGRKDKSLDAQFNTDSDSGTLLDLMPGDELSPFDTLLNIENKEIIINLLNTLQGYNKLIMELYYGINDNIPMTISYIADKLNLTEYQVQKKINNNLKQFKLLYQQSNNIKKPNIIIKKPTKEVIKNYVKQQEEKPVIVKPVIVKPVIVKPVIVKPSIVYTDITKPKVSTIITPEERNILDHYFGAFTGVKSTNGEVARKLNISKLDVIAAVKKYKLIYG